MNKKLMILALVASAGTALAAPRETRFAPAALDSDDGNTAFSLNFTGSDGGGAYSARRVRFTCTLTSNVAATYAQEAVLDVTPPGGAMQSFVLGAGLTYTTQSVDITRSFAAAPVAVAGDWQFNLRETADDLDGTPDSFVNDLAVTLDDAPPPPPSTVELGTLTSDTTVNGEVPAGGPLFYRFAITTAANDADNRYFDIDTNGTGFDTEIGLYTDTGVRIANNDDTGVGTASFLSFGAGGGPAQSDNGSNGINGDLAAGTYILVVSQYDTVFGATVDAITYSPTAGGGTATVTFTMGDSVPPPPPTEVNLGTLSTDTTVNGTVANGSAIIYQFTLTESATLADFRYFDIDTNGSAVDTEIGLFDIDGNQVDIDDDFGVGASSLLSFGSGGGTAQTDGGPGSDGFNGDLAAGTYFLVVSAFNTEFGASIGDNQYPLNAGGDVTVTFSMGQVTPPPPPTEVNLGNMTSDVTVNGTVANGSAIIYQFTLTQDVTMSAPRFLDIDTNGSALDTEIAVFDSVGTFVATDDDFGVGLQSLLSFGSGGGTAQTDGGSGSDGFNGNLIAGTYFLVVSGYDTEFGDNIGDNAYPILAGGDVVVNFTIGTPVTQTAPEATDLGEIGAGVGGTEVVTTVMAPITAGAVTWYKFSTGADALNGSTDYMDIDTHPDFDDGAPTVGSINDTELGLFRNITGLAVAIDDDSSSGLHSMLSFGDDVNFRPPNGNGFPGDGANGDLVAGTYYLAVGCFNVVFTNPYGATSDSPAEGEVQLNFRTNIPGGGPAGPCSLADLGVAGGLPGQDRLLNNNDFIAFIAYFFAQNPAADLGIAGGLPGSDGQWNNNDFIAFIAHFFADGVDCNG